MFPVFAAKQREKKKTESSIPSLFLFLFLFFYFLEEEDRVITSQTFVLVNAAVCHETPNRIVMSVFDWDFQPKGKQRTPPHLDGIGRQIQGFVQRNPAAGTNNIFCRGQKMRSQRGAYFPRGFTSGVARSTSSSIARGDEFLCSGKLLSRAILAI